MLDRLRRFARPMSAEDPRSPEERARDERAKMVDVQIRARGVADERVLAALLAVPRDAFVAADLRGSAYADDALPIEAGQTISQPYIVGRMTELLRVGPGDPVLDVGTGSGYQAAVLAQIGCRVVSIERHESLADAARERLARLGYGDRVEIRVGDGSRNPKMRATVRSASIDCASSADRSVSPAATACNVSATWSVEQSFRR